MVRRGTKCLRKKKDADRCTKKSRNLELLKREEGLPGCYETFSDHRLLMGWTLIVYISCLHCALGSIIRSIH